MPDYKYVKSGQWHVLATIDDTGWHARCGVDLSSAMRAANTLPINERTCNNCLELIVHDKDAAEAVDVPGGEVPEPQ